LSNKYIAEIRINHDGKKYPKGSLLELDTKEAAPLLKIKAIKPENPEPEEKKADGQDEQPDQKTAGKGKKK
jgi:hypothetical protein